MGAVHRSTSRALSLECGYPVYSSTLEGDHQGLAHASYGKERQEAPRQTSFITPDNGNRTLVSPGTLSSVYMSRCSDLSTTFYLSHREEMGRWGMCSCYIGQEMVIYSPLIEKFMVTFLEKCTGIYHVFVGKN